MRLRNSLSSLRPSGSGSGAADPTTPDPHPFGGIRWGFVTSRLAAGAAGLACLPVYLVWRGAPSGADAILAACMAAPVVASFVAVRGGRPAAAGYAVAAAGSAGIVAVLLAGAGLMAWPAVFLLAAEPMEARAAQGRGAALATALASGFAGALLLCLLALLPSLAPASAGTILLAQVAAAVLALAWLARVGLARAAAAPSERALVRAPDAIVTWHDGRGDVVHAEGGERVCAMPDGLLGSGLFRRVHVTDRPAFLQALSDATHRDGVVSAEVRLHAEAAFRGSGAARILAGGVTAFHMDARRTAGAAPGDALVQAVLRPLDAAVRATAPPHLASAPATLDRSRIGRLPTGHEADPHPPGTVEPWRSAPAEAGRGAPDIPQPGADRAAATATAPAAVKKRMTA